MTGGKPSGAHLNDQTDNIRWGTLLLLLVAAFLAEPVFGMALETDLASLVLFEMAVIGSVYMGARYTWLRIVGSVLAGIWFIFSLLAVFGIGYGVLLPWLSLALVFGSLTTTFLNLLQRDQGDVETLLGAIFGYLLLAMAWAMLYAQIERWSPGSFAELDGTDAWTSLLYFSLVTLTTVGYGDILPVSSAARLAAGFEAVVGVLYIAVMVGSIVGNLHRRRSD